MTRPSGTCCMGRKPHPLDGAEDFALAALVDAGFSPYAAKIALTALRRALQPVSFIDQRDPGDEQPEDDGFITVHASGPCEGFGPRGNLESRN